MSRLLSMRLSTATASARRYKINPTTISSLSRVPQVKHHFTIMYEGGYESELPEQYRPGGFHPILLGDVFKNGRYKVIQKIGWGGFATIWVARDQLLVLPLH